MSIKNRFLLKKLTKQHIFFSGIYFALYDEFVIQSQGRLYVRCSVDDQFLKATESAKKKESNV
jgi:hypothetical protein